MIPVKMHFLAVAKATAWELDPNVRWLFPILVGEITMFADSQFQLVKSTFFFHVRINLIPDKEVVHNFRPGTTVGLKPNSRVC